MAGYWDKMKQDICERNGVSFKQYKCFRRSIRKFLKKIDERECWDLFYRYSGLEQKENKRLRKFHKEKELKELREMVTLAKLTIEDMV